MVLLAAGGLAPTGCDRQPTPAIAVPARLPDTPEGKLEGIMQRLKNALEIANSARGSGVVSERTASYKLLEPKDSGSSPSAEVTISTTVARDAKADKPSGDEGKGEAAEKPAAAGPVEPTVKKEVFVLNYERDAWIMAATPKGEVERLLFGAALKGQ